MPIKVNVYCLVRKSTEQQYSKRKVIVTFHEDDAPSDLKLDVVSRRDAISWLESFGYTDITIQRVELP